MTMRLLLSIGLVLIIVAQTVALQNPPASNAPSKTQQPQDDKNKATQPNATGQEGVVKIGVTLVQLDVTVTDKKGQPVGDLRPEDFEVVQNNRPQHITNFSYISSAPAAPAEATKPADKKSPAEPPAPPPRLKPESIHRTIALVVDDLSLSFESTGSVRQALKKFVDEQMQPGDLVAILRTAAGMGALQQFTNDKRLLYAAIERVRWSPSHGSINTFAPVTTNPPAVPMGPIDAPRGNLSFDMDGT